MPTSFLSRLLGCALLIPVSAAYTTQAMATDHQATIQQYRQLRSMCAQQQPQDRRSCFAELNKLTPAYQLAKKALKTTKAHIATNS